jgi:hypothetical protein
MGQNLVLVVFSAAAIARLLGEGFAGIAVFYLLQCAP